MILVSERTTTQANGWGQDQTTTRKHYAIEAVDVGVQKEHYLGHRYAKRTFQKSDIGREIVVLTMPSDPNWACWHFYVINDDSQASASA